MSEYQGRFEYQALSQVEKDQLLQIYLKDKVWDGDLISKLARDELVKQGLVEQQVGFNLITIRGMREVASWKWEEHSESNP